MNRKQEFARDWLRQIRSLYRITTFSAYNMLKFDVSLILVGEIELSLQLN